jgi:hypothetical protein
VAENADGIPGPLPTVWISTLTLGYFSSRYSASESSQFLFDRSNRRDAIPARMSDIGCVLSSGRDPLESLVGACQRPCVRPASLRKSHPLK